MKIVSLFMFLGGGGGISHGHSFVHQISLTYPGFSHNVLLTVGGQVRSLSGALLGCVGGSTDSMTVSILLQVVTMKGISTQHEMSPPWQLVCS